MWEEDILKDPQVSPWLRDALRAALSCDPVRVANDAACLSQLLQRRAARDGPSETGWRANRRRSGGARKKARAPGR